MAQTGPNWPSPITAKTRHGHHAAQLRTNHTRTDWTINKFPCSLPSALAWSNQVQPGVTQTPMRYVSKMQPRCPAKADTPDVLEELFTSRGQQHSKIINTKHRMLDPVHNLALAPDLSLTTSSFTNNDDNRWHVVETTIDSCPLSLPLPLSHQLPNPRLALSRF